MNLFNKKTLERYTKADAIPVNHLSILKAWADLINSERIKSIKETALHSQFTSKIVEGVLGYRGPAESSDYSVSSEQAILRGSVDLALGRFGSKVPEIIAPFELKGAATRDLDAIMPGRNKSPVQQAWEYATNARGVKWVIVSNYIELRLYGFGEGTTAFEQFFLDRLTDSNEYARFILLLSEENLLSGRTLDLLKESRQEDNDITDKLYQDYKTLRQKLISAVGETNKAIAPLVVIAAAQKILDRVLFIAFAEDTGLLPRNSLNDAFASRDRYNPQPVWRNFCGLFKAINEGSDGLNIPRYNGGLFKTDELIDNLKLPDDVCLGFKKIGDYDFASEVSVTVLGHIFEQSITDVERLQAAARGEEQDPEKVSGTTGRRKRDGVVYTPDYIARFIVEETIGVHLREAFTSIISNFARKGSDITNYETIPWRRKSAELEAWQAYRERLRTLRVVDPACGSGVFLIMAFDHLKAELIRVNEKIRELSPVVEHFGDLLDYVPDSEILTNNLFGVDVNEESVEITKLSLWIKTAKRGKVLDSLDKNIRVGDSLIEDSNFAYLRHAFKWSSAFPAIFKEGGFDIVLGNPPYVRMELLKQLKPYLEARYEVVSDRADLYCYFYERGLRLLKEGGRLGYISSNTFFKTGSGGPLRKYILKESNIESIVDFGDLQIFEGVTTYPAIVTMRRGVSPTPHDLFFWKVDTLPENNFRASWEAASGPYPQSELGTDSWELENPELRALRQKIRLGKKNLKEAYGSPMYGIKTGLNEAFVIDTPTKERICSADPKSIELLRPFFEGKDLKRWRSESRGLWILYIPQRKINIEHYPAVRDWLFPFKSTLENRATKQEWFELQQAQEAYAPHFGPPKIVYGHFQDAPIFSMDKSGSYSNNKTYFIPTSDWSLLALLNSKVVWFDFCSRTTAVRGGWREATAQHIEKLSIPYLRAEIKEQLADLARAAQAAAEERLKLQSAFRRRIADICPADRDPKLSTKLQDWWTLPSFAAFRQELKRVFKADIPVRERSDWEDWFDGDRFSVNDLSAQIVKQEIRINSIVYGLFELDEKEVALLEASI